MADDSTRVVGRRFGSPPGHGFIRAPRRARRLNKPRTRGDAETCCDTEAFGVDLALALAGAVGELSVRW